MCEPLRNWVDCLFERRSDDKKTVQGYIHRKESFTILQGKDSINGKALINLFCKLTKIRPLLTLSVWLKIDCLLWLSMVWTWDGVVYFTIAPWLFGFLNVGSKLKVACWTIPIPIHIVSISAQKRGGFVSTPPTPLRLIERWRDYTVDTRF